MTVDELIVKLQDYPAGTPVYVDDDGRAREPWPVHTRNYMYGERDDLAGWKVVL